VLPIEEAVRDVVRYTASAGSALSLYLDTDPSRAEGRNLKAQIRSALDELRELAPGGAPDPDIQKAAARALEAIAALQPTPRAVAAFVNPESGYERVVPLPEPVGRSAHWGKALNLRPLLAALDEHERTVVVLVDQEHGHVFRVFLGQIERMADFEHEDTGYAQAGRAARKSTGRGQTGSTMGYGERNLQRRHEWHVHKHLERVLAAMRLRGDRLLVGGGRETVQELIRLLPKPLRDRTTVIEGIDCNASMSSVLEHVLQTQRRAEREWETAFVHELIEESRGPTVFGAAAVAEAVSDARVHTLVYAASASMPGAECSTCGWMMPGASAVCPRCGGALAETPDLVQRLISQVLLSGGRVEEVRGDAQAILQEREGLAALLRYVPAGPPNERPSSKRHGKPLATRKSA
jgi:peptide subunit release factor 1 (eRF1)